MNPAGVHEHPGDECDGHVDGPPLDALPLQEAVQRQQGHRDHECQRVESLGVEHRDDQDRAEVVDHRQRQQERPQRHRKASTHDRQDRQRECDVGGHGDPPPAGLPVGERQVDRDVEQRGQGHATECCCDGDCGALGRGEGPELELVAKLHTRNEEEDRQQAIGCPHGQRQIQMQRGWSDDGVRDRLVRRRPGAVGPDQCDGSGDQEQDAAGRLVTQGAEDPRPLRQRQPSEQPVAGVLGVVGCSSHLFTLTTGDGSSRTTLTP